MVDVRARDFSKTFNGVTVKAKGLGSASRALSRAGDYAEDQRELMHQIGMIVVTEAKTLVPVGRGYTRDSIRAGRGKTKAVVRAGNRWVKYAPVIHYGWAENNIEPQPYLLNALVKKREEVVRKYEEGFEALLFKAGLDPSRGSIVPSSRSFTLNE